MLYTFYYHMQKQKITGFTIVELLIVIVVIGILAAITIVAYNGIQERARAASATTALSQASKILATYQVDFPGIYPADKTALAAIGIKDSSDVTYQYSRTPSTPNTYCITATSGSTSYMLSSTGVAPQKGACAGHGSGGVAAITNLATNPGAEVNTTGMSGTVARATDWAASGVASFISAPGGTSNDTYISYGGDLGGLRLGMQAGRTYTVSGTVRLTAPLAGSLAGNGTRQITGWYTSAAGSHTRVLGTQAPNAAGTTRVSMTYSIPSDAIGAWIRLYNGASSGNGSVWWDNIMVTEGSTVYDYADGTSLNWVWNGTDHNSTSTGPPL